MYIDIKYILKNALGKDTNIIHYIVCWAWAEILISELSLKYSVVWNPVQIPVDANVDYTALEGQMG